MKSFLAMIWSNLYAPFASVAAQGRVHLEFDRSMRTTMYLSQSQSAPHSARPSAHLPLPGSALPNGQLYGRANYFGKESLDFTTIATVNFSVMINPLDPMKLALAPLILNSHAFILA
jgi:hypothetical protein